MPCGYDYNAYYWTRQPWGLWTWVSAVKGTPFGKRLEWIGNCASIRGGYLHHFDYIKANTSRYIFEVFVVEAPKRFPWGWGTAAFELPFHSCYFLGSFPNYWDVQNRQVAFAHNMNPATCYPIGKNPTLLEHYVSDYETKAFQEIAETFGKQNLTDYFYPQFIPTERYEEGEEQIKQTRAAIDKALFEFTTFYQKYELEHYLLQYFDLDARQKRFLQCVARTWPKPVREIKPLPPPPAQPEAVNATPMDEIPLPLPERSPGGIVPPGSIGLGIDISFGIKPTGYGNTLQLTLTIYQGMF